MNALSGIVFFLGFVPYIWAIFRGETVPSPISWLIWASVDTLALIAMIKEKSKIGQLLGAISGAWTITILAVFLGKPTMGYIEWVSIVGAICGIILWKRTGNAVTAIICFQATIFFGAIPTFVNAYQDASKEDPVAWSIWLVSCICALLAVKKWDLANALQPLNFTIIEVIMVVLVVIRPLF